MTTQRILLLSYIVLGVIVALALEHLFGGPVSSIPHLGFFGRTFFGTEMFWSVVAGFVTAGAIGVYCWVDPRVKEPAIQVVEELQRVTWPTFRETRTATVAVVVATAIVAILLGAFDYGWGYVTKAIYAEATGQTTDTNQNP